MVVPQSGTPLVSVIIPAYNHERFIEAAIDSVLGQTMDDLELIVVDDGSTDTTLERIRAYDDSRLRSFTQENQDAYNTINRGISLACGQYYAILNSDDIFEKDRLEQLLVAQKESDAICLFTDVTPISDAGEVFSDPAFGWNVWHQKNREYAEHIGELYRAFLHGNFMVTTSNLFMTAEAAETVGAFCSSRYFHDYDYIFRMLLAFPGKVRYLADQKLLCYRIHSGNTLGEAAIRGRIEELQMIRRYMQMRLPETARGDVDTGGARLIQLGEELQEVYAALAGDQPDIGVRRSFALFRYSLMTWLKKKTGTTPSVNK